MSTLNSVLAFTGILLPLLSGGLFAEGSSSGVSVGEIVEQSSQAGYKIAPNRLRGVSSEDLAVISEALEDLSGYASCRQGDQWNFDGECAAAEDAIKAIEDRLRLSASGSASRSDSNIGGNSLEQNGSNAPVIEGHSGASGSANPEAASKKFDRSQGSSGANLRPAVHVPEGGSELLTSQMTGPGGSAPRVSGGRTRSLYRSASVASNTGNYHGGIGGGGLGARSSITGDFAIRTSKEGKLSSDELPIAQSKDAQWKSPVNGGVYEEKSGGEELFSRLGLRIGFLLMGTTGNHALAAAVFAEEKNDNKRAHWVGVLPLNDESNYKMFKFVKSLETVDRIKKNIETTILTDKMDEKNREVIVKINENAVDAADAAVKVMAINFDTASDTASLKGLIGQAIKETGVFYAVTKVPNLQTLAAKANVALKDLQEKAQKKEDKDLEGIRGMKEYRVAVESMNELDKAIIAHYDNANIANVVDNMKMEFRFKMADIWAAVRASFDDNDSYLIAGKEYWLQDLPVFRGDMTVKALLVASVPHDEKRVKPQPVTLKGTPFINADDSKQIRILAFFEKPADAANLPKVVAMLPIASNTGDIVGAGTDGTVSIKLGKDSKAPEITIKKSDLGPGSTYRWEIEDKSSGGGSPAGAPPGGAASSSADKPKVGSFKVEPAIAKKGDKVQLIWSVENATKVEINSESKGLSGTESFTIGNTSKKELVWKLVATNANGTTEQTMTLTIESGSSSSGTKPKISSFKADKSSVKAGESVTFSWSVSGASEVKFDGAVVAASGSQVVAPSATKTYTLSAKSASGGSNSKSVAITVGAATPAPEPPPSSDSSTASLWAKDKSAAVLYDAAAAGACTKGKYQAPGTPNDAPGHPAAAHKHRYCCVEVSGTACTKVTGSVEVK